MATGDVNVADISMSANANLSAKQYYAVTLVGNRTVDTCNATTVPLGILQDNPNAAGRSAAVRVGGTSKFKCGANITYGQRVIVDANGAGAPIGSNNAVLYNVVGVALESAVTDDIFQLLVQPAGVRVA